MKNAPNIIISCTFNMKSRLWRYIWYLVRIHSSYMFDQTIQLSEQLCHIFTSIPICWWIFPNISRYLETRSRFSILLTTFVIALETLGMCLWSPFVLARPTPEKINWSNYDVVVKVFLSSNSHIINFSKKFFLEKVTSGRQMCWVKRWIELPCRSIRTFFDGTNGNEFSTRAEYEMDCYHS